MAERLTEHVHRDADGRLWQRYDRLDRQGRPEEPAYHPLQTEPACELTQALLAERKRVGKLRAALEDIAEMRLYGGDTLWTKAAKAALEEDGEGLQDG